MTRFDLPEPMKALLALALSTGLADALDLYTLGATHGTDFKAMRAELLEWAFARHHDPEGRAIHAKIAAACDACHVAGV